MAEIEKSEQEQQVDKLIQLLDNLDLKQYVRLARRPGKLLFLNFISGMAKGLGFTIGTAIVLAVMFEMIAELISMNIPYLTELLERFVVLVKNIE